MGTERKNVARLFLVGLFLCVASAGATAQQNDIERRLLRLHQEYLPGANYSDTIHYPKPPEFYTGWAGVVISASADLAIIFTAGHSEIAVKVLDNAGLIVDGVELAGTGRAGEFIIKEAGVEGGNYFLKKVVTRQIPGVRTAVSTYFAVKTTMDLDRLIQERIEKNAQWVNCFFALAPEGIELLDQFASVSDPALQQEYQAVLLNILQRKAQVAAYRQMAWMDVSEGAGKSIQAELLQILRPGMGTNVTVDMNVGETVRRYLDGQASKAEVEAAFRAFIANLGPGFTLTQAQRDRAWRRIHAEIAVWERQRDRVNRYGGVTGSVPSSYDELLKMMGLSRKRTVALDVALVIDSSGSMKETDRTDLRKRAADLFIDLVGRGDLVTVVDFDDTVKMLADGSSDRAELHAAVARIDSAGKTDISGGLARAHEALSSRSTAARKAALLLSDGAHTVGSFDAAAVDRFRRSGWPVFAVGLSGQADEALLARIARETGGEYFRAADAQVLQKIFNVISTRVKGAAAVKIIHGLIGLGEELTRFFDVDASQRNLLISLFWPGSTLGMRLTDPSGNPVPLTTTGGTYLLARVDRPAPGKWSAVIRGEDVAAGGEPFDLTVAADTPLRLEPAGFRDECRPGEPLALSFDLGELRGGTGEMSVTDPAGARKTVRGTLSGRFLRFVYTETTQPGSYTLEYEVQGKRGSGETVTRADARTVRFAGAPAAPASIPPPLAPGVGQVVRVEGGYVTVNIGRAEGVREGRRLVVYSDEALSVVAASGLAVEVNAHTCMVELDAMPGRAIRPGMGVRIKGAGK